MKQSQSGTNRSRVHFLFAMLALAVGLAGMARAAVTVDRDYTFNNGSEAGLITFFKTGSEAPVYTNGQVTLPPNTYLMGTNLYSISPTNFGVEIIVAQTSDTSDSRWILDTSRGYQINLFGKSSWMAQDDTYGFSWSSAAGVTTGTEYRLAIVVTNNSATGTNTATFYRDGVKVGSRSGSSTNFPAYALTNLMIGAANRTEKTGFSATPSTIRVNEVRLFHFSEGQFNPATDLLSAPTVSSNQALTVTLASPTNNQMFLTDASISATATVSFGTAPYKVQFYKKLQGGFFSPIGTLVTNAPYQVIVGMQTAGSYSIYASAFDATNGFCSSATNAFTVVQPVITVDRQYTFNSGPEPGLSTFYKTGREDPVYSRGQVVLGPNTYLKGASLYSNSPVNFGVEAILTQTSDSPGEQRWVLDTASQPSKGFQFYLLGQQAWHAQDDVAGDWATAAGVVTGAEYRLACVVSGNADGTLTETFYCNNAKIASRSGVASNFMADMQSDLWVGGAKWADVTGTSAVPCTIKVNEIRLFHFASGMFSPSLLLTNATPVPLTADFSAFPTNGIVPLTVTFDDTSIQGPAGPISARYWDFGDGGIALTAATNLSHTYTNAGTYTVKLIVSDSFGGSSTNSKSGCIVVAPAPPAAGFSAAPSSGDVPLTVNFTDVSTPGSSGPIISRYWDFGDGASTFAFTTNLTHTYTNAGTYGVTLVVRDIAGASTNAQPGLITARPPPGSYREAVLRDGPVAYYEMNEAGGTVATDTMGTVNAVYGTNAVLGQVNFNFPSLGTGAGNTTLSAPGLLAIPGDSRLTTTGAFSLEFWYRQTQSVVTNQNHLFRPEGNESDGSLFECYVTGSGSLYCNGSQTGPGTSAFNAWHHLVVTRDSGNNAVWYLDGTSVAFQMNTNSLLSPGVVTSLGGGGVGGSAFEGTLDEIAIYTNVLTPARIAAHRAAATNYMPLTASFRATPTNGPSPLEVTFTDTSTGAPVNSRFWDFGDGASTFSSSNTVVHAYSTPHTTNTVRLVVSGPLNTSTNTQTGLIVVGAPEAVIADFDASQTNGTAPLTVFFTDNSTGPVTNRVWSFGDGATTNTSVTSLYHIYTNAGTYGVQLVVGGLAGNSTNSKPGLIVVAPPVLPVASFGASPTSGVAPLTVTFSDTSAPGSFGLITNRFWSFGDGATTNTSTTNLTHTYAVAGTYGVTLAVSGREGGATNSKPGLIVVTSSAPPVPALTGGGFKVSGGNATFRFDTAAGFKYGMDYKTTLTNSAWLPLILPPDYTAPSGWSANISTGAPMTLIDTNAAGQPRRYYRLKAVAP